jgi:YbbR domain-containing protein
VHRQLPERLTARWPAWRRILPVIAGNLPLALVALLLAALLWVAVTNEQNPTVRRDAGFQAKIQSVNVPGGLLVSGLSPDRVSITLTGPRDRVQAVQQQDVSVHVDLSSATGAVGAGDQTLHFTVPADVSVRQRDVQADISPQSILVTLEPEVRRTVPVKVSTSGTLPAGFALDGAPTAQPAQVTIAGTSQDVNVVDAAVVDAGLDGLTVNVEQSFELNPRDAAGHSIGHVTVIPSTATVSIHVKQISYTRQFLIDPHVRGRPAPGYTTGTTQVQPSGVSVAGSLDALSQVSTLPTQDVDVEGATSDVVRTVALVLPQGLTLSDAKTTIVVRVPVSPETGPGSLGVAPKVTGLGSGLTAAVQTPTVVVNLTGPLPFLLSLTPADVVVAVDAGGLGPGTYRLEPKVSVPAGLQVDGLVPERVAVTITPSGTGR